MKAITLDRLKRDVLAGLTIGVVAVPLSMALAVATGVPPQHGLYTAIVALASLRRELGEQGVGIVFVGLPPRLALKLKRAGIKRETGKLAVVRTLAHAERVARRWLGGGR
ncbi:MULTISPECIES: SulP family inorganic anion transporter [unclassified Halomonas]|uniref:SulP family inorganic anion transporter n=1 Tax=unclassified Halomonas TaxID=2609666 RepID=UPI002016A270|nr:MULTISPECIES: SulP family inorganic anion transporter [unclassified Halomonas]